MKEPMPAESSTDLSQSSRNFFCRHYNNCLDMAIQKDWVGFSCEKCQGYEREQMDHEQWCEDSLRCLRLVWAVSYCGLKQAKARSDQHRQVIAIQRDPAPAGVQTSCH